MQQQQSSSRWARLCTEVGHYDPLMAGSIDGTDKIPHDRGIIRAIEAKCNVRVTIDNIYSVVYIIYGVT